MDYKLSVFIGRFQPFHKAHLEVALQGLEIAEKLLIIIGSAKAARNIKNPWTFEERKSMVLSCFSPQQRERIEILPIRDYFYSDSIWVADIQSKVSQFAHEGDSVALLGSYKDSSSYYINLFPQWEFVPAKTKSSLNATDVREVVFNSEGQIADVLDKIPESVGQWLMDSFFGSETHASLIQEAAFVQKYRDQWKGSPFPPTFVTVDAVVVCAGHVLVVRRKFNPGKGLIALPGGFIKNSERIEDAAVRELKEETGIFVDKKVLRGSIVESHVFDYPGRSLRGRTITHAFLIKLDLGYLPQVRGGDDAEVARWIPLLDASANEADFYEDHHSIIQYFISRI